MSLVSRPTWPGQLCWNKHGCHQSLLNQILGGERALKLNVIPNTLLLVFDILLVPAYFLKPSWPYYRLLFSGTGHTKDTKVCPDTCLIYTYNRQFLYTLYIMLPQIIVNYAVSDITCTWMSTKKRKVLRWLNFCLFVSPIGVARFSTGKKIYFRINELQKFHRKHDWDKIFYSYLHYR